MPEGFRYPDHMNEAPKPQAADFAIADRLLAEWQVSHLPQAKLESLRNSVAGEVADDRALNADAEEMESRIRRMIPGLIKSLKAS